jgi:hypothetical protein
MSEVQSEQAASRTEMAAMRREIGDLRSLIQALIPVSERTAVLVEQVDRVESDVSRVEVKFDKRWDKLETAQEASRKDSRGLRNLLIGVGVAAVLSPIGGILVAVAAGKP